eukprot:1185628-Prorocentrum_minimum.AAC.3
MGIFSRGHLTAYRSTRVCSNPLGEFETQTELSATICPPGVPNPASKTRSKNDPFDPSLSVFGRRRLHPPTNRSPSKGISRTLRPITAPQKEYPAPSDRVSRGGLEGVSRGSRGTS